MDSSRNSAYLYLLLLIPVLAAIWLLARERRGKKRKELPTKELPNEQFLPEIIRLINEGHTVTLTLKGKSMRPFLEDGRDKGLLTKVGDVKVGDPVLAETWPGRYVLHRVVSIKGDNITLRGDGNILTEHCKLGDIKASCAGFYRKGRATMDSVDGKKWRIYSWIWMRLLPVRRYLLAIYRRKKLFPLILALAETWLLIALQHRGRDGRRLSNKRQTTSI